MMIPKRVLAGARKVLAGICILLAHINSSNSQDNFESLEFSDISSNEISLGQPWPNAVVPYVIHPTSKLTPEQSALILAAMGEVTEKTCVTFRVHDWAKKDEPFLLIVDGPPGTKCKSMLGYAPKKRSGFSGQMLSLEGRRCFKNVGQVIRQLLKTLGLPQVDTNDIDDYDQAEQGGNHWRRRRQASQTEPFTWRREDILTLRKLYNFDPDVCEALCNGRRCVKETTTTTTARPKPKSEPRLSSHAPAKAHLFSEIGHKGIREEFNDDSIATVGCQNLKQLAGRVKSIHTYNTCVQVYHERDCKGKSLQFHPWSVDHQGRHQGHADMGQDWWSIRSIGPCTKSPQYRACPQHQFQCRDGRCLKSYVDCVPKTRWRRDVIPFANATMTSTQ